MPDTSQYFMRGLIDYAGLFPPAALPMEKAIAEYTAYEAGPDRAVLGRFICPVSRLGELYAYRSLFNPQRVFRFSVLAATAADMDKIRQFEEIWGGTMNVEVLEVKLSGIEGLAPFYSVDLPVFWEITPFTADMLPHLAASGKKWGIKLRCGGTESAHFPTPEHVAAVIHHTLAARLPFKATAGLHHPVRHYDTGIGVMMHGYLNVFFAVILGSARDLNLNEITQIVMEENPAAFQFLPDGGIQFGTWKSGPEEVKKLREHVALSYGSCSFREPVDELLPFLTPSHG